MFKRIIAMVLLGATVTLVGCNTMAGLGRDVERGGQKLHEEARETQQEMRR